jgi:multidrug efflux system outer membrane protein
MKRFNAAMLVLAAAVLAACGTLEPGKATVDVPEAAAPAPASIERWWTAFNDARLNALVDEALANNLDLRIAMARIDEARAGLQLARSALFPSLDASVSSQRVRSSQATSQPGQPLTLTIHNAGLQAAYEVDVWGRVRAGRDAAGARLRASEFDAQSVRIALAAQVATTYFALRAFDADLALTKATLGTRDEFVRLQRRRAEAGEANQYELAQAEAERAAVAATVPLLERAIAQSQSALAALAGRSARNVYAPTILRGADIEKIDAGPDVPAGLTSDLLARRPDVRRADALLLAADARFHEARAQYYPRLTLTASAGSESTELSDLFTTPTRVWSIGAGLLQPIIGMKRIGAEVDVAVARREQAALAWQQSVQSALRDVHDALVAHRSARDSFVSFDERRERLAQAYRLSDLRYKSGYSSYIEVLDAQRGLLAAERDRINALRDRQSALVGVYKALGGGWTPAP